MVEGKLFEPSSLEVVGGRGAEAGKDPPWGSAGESSPKRPD